MEALQNKKTDALTEATFPVDGLGFDENGVTFDGKPFTQASGAEQLRVSLAMAMALNPQLKVIHIKNGSLLDSENMQIIEDMAKDKDYQVWIEVVDESGKVGIYIEDGEVKQTA
jgi:ABC-type histidine transport system ATPase subunit